MKKRPSGCQDGVDLVKNRIGGNDVEIPLLCYDPHHNIPVVPVPVLIAEIAQNLLLVCLFLLTQTNHEFVCIVRDAEFSEIAGIQKMLQEFSKIINNRKITWQNSAVNLKVQNPAPVNIALPDVPVQNLISGLFGGIHYRTALFESIDIDGIGAKIVDQIHLHHGKTGSSVPSAFHLLLRVIALRKDNKVTVMQEDWVSEDRLAQVKDFLKGRLEQKCLLNLQIPFVKTIKEILHQGENLRKAVIVADVNPPRHGAAERGVRIPAQKQESPAGENIVGETV